MLIFDGLTLIVCGALVLLAAASALTDTFMRRLPQGAGCADGEGCAVGEGSADSAERLEPVTVIIVADNNARELDKHLPAFLSQSYPAGYEVVVVVSRDEDNTDDVLKACMARHENLRTTFVPDSSRYMSRRKLAITLGVRAAKHNLILLTDAGCRPDTGRWISAMASARASSGAGMVIGYSNYDAEATPFSRFERLFREFAFMREAAAGRPYAMAGSNLLFSKSMFMEGKGFQGNLKYLRGEYEFLVNKYGRSHRAAAAAAPDSFLTEDAPTRKARASRSVFYAETRRHLERGLRHRLAFNADMLSLHLCLLAPLAAAVFACLTGRWPVLPVAALALLVPLITRSVAARRAARSFSLSLPAWLAVPFETRLVWHNLATLCRHKRADKTDFISHKS